MRRFKDISILYKLVVINAIIISVVIVSFMSIHLRHEKNEHLGELEKEGRIIAENLAYNSALPVLTRNSELMAGYIDGALTAPDMVYGAVYFTDGSLFIKRASREFDNYMSLDPDTLKNEEGGLFFNKSLEMIDVFAPVYSESIGGSREEMGLMGDIVGPGGGEREEIAYVVVSLSAAVLAKKFRDTVTYTATTALSVALIGISVIAFILKRLVRPIRDLSSGAMKVSEGDMDVHIEVKSDDEVGMLSSAFNHMVYSLKSHISRLRENAEDIENLFDGAMDGIFLLCGSCVIVRINREMASALGYDREELIGLKMHDISDIKHDEVCEEVKRSGSAVMKEINFIARDGASMPFEVNLMEVNYERKKGVLGFARDVSERKVMERHLIQSEKLAATGRLAADVAHEVNNPLAIIKNYLAILKKESEFVKGDIAESVDIIDDEINRIAEIIRGLLTFSRPETRGAPSSDINEIIGQILKLTVKPLEKRGIRFKADLDISISEVAVYSGHVKQVFINLINNARDAMPDGGELRIRTYDDDGRGVVIEVEDSGEGIDEESIREVFSPFYTTKGVKGTGLGLSVSYGIVKGYGGEISLENREEGGVRARAFLPYKEKEVADE